MLLLLSVTVSGAVSNCGNVTLTNIVITDNIYGQLAIVPTLPPGPWMTLPQSHIDAFAEATGDRQWIHTDPERASRESPFGGAVAHGFLTASLLPRLLAEAIDGTIRRSSDIFPLIESRLVISIPYIVTAAELRRRNLLKSDELPHTNPFGMVYDSGDYHDAMEKAFVLGNWAGFEQRRAEVFQERGRDRLVHGVRCASRFFQMCKPGWTINLQQWMDQ